MNIALLVTAGKGTRLGMDTNKAFVTLRGEPLFYYPIKLFEELEFKSLVKKLPDDSWENMVRNTVGVSKNKEPATRKARKDEKAQRVRKMRMGRWGCFRNFSLFMSRSRVV